MRYLITGGAGFIGSHLVDALLGRGDSVLIVDDLSTGRLINIEHVLDDDRVEFVEGSVLDEGLLDDCMHSADACFHLASAVGVQLVVSRPLSSLRRNIRGNDIVISSAARRCTPLVFASTSEIYGKNSSTALSEDSDRLLGPISKLRWSYANAKAFGEALVYSYAREQNCPMAVVRLFNTVGPRQTGAYGMVLPRFVRQALRGDDLTVYGDGTQSRCFGHVLDVVQGIVMVADEPHAVGRPFNIGSPIETTVIDLARRVIERAGSSSSITLVPYEVAYDEGFEELGKRKPDTAALERMTGWRATRTIDEAIDDAIAYEQGVGTLQEKLRLVG